MSESLLGRLTSLWRTKPGVTETPHADAASSAVDAARLPPDVQAPKSAAGESTSEAPAALVETSPPASSEGLLDPESLPLRAVSPARPSAAIDESPPPAEPTPPPEPPPAAAPKWIPGTADPEAIARVASGRLREELRERAAGIVEKWEALLASDALPGLAFDSDRENRDQQAFAVALPADANVWFVGDVHGDLLGLECVLDYIDRWPAAKRPIVVFLGDLFDDGAWSYETLLRVLDRLLEAPERGCVITGNHDDGLLEQGERFTSTVLPSNFSEWLNEKHADEMARRTARVAIQFFKQAPRALFLPDGLIAAHGGVPHSDLQASLASSADLNRPECLQDFVWTRLHDRARRRIPNRTTRGCEVGREDFEDFCRKAAVILGRPVTGMVRGHDHLDRKERFAWFAKYEKNPVLTINTMCCRLPREAFGPYERVPCVAHWRSGDLPEVHGVEFPVGVITSVYPPEASSPSPPELSE